MVREPGGFDQSRRSGGVSRKIQHLRGRMNMVCFSSDGDGPSRTVTRNLVRVSMFVMMLLPNDLIDGSSYRIKPPMGSGGLGGSFFPLPHSASPRPGPPGTTYETGSVPASDDARANDMFLLQAFESEHDVGNPSGVESLGAGMMNLNGSIKLVGFARAPRPAVSANSSHRVVFGRMNRSRRRVAAVNEAAAFGNPLVIIIITLRDIAPGEVDCEYIWYLACVVFRSHHCSFCPCFAPR
jgi:hypothetical protein